MFEVLSIKSQVLRNAGLVFLLFAIFLFFSVDVDAQCAMCKTVANSDKQAGGSFANGLNKGILYLMAVPYVLIFIVGYFVIKNLRKKTPTY